MSERDYEKDPIIVEATIRVYIYHKVDNIEGRLERAAESLSNQENALSLVTDAIGEADAGLDDFVLTGYRFVK